VVLIGHFCLGVPIRGSLMLLLFGSLLFLICALGLGLLASTLTVTVSSSQILTLLIALLPSILLSGFIFPIESMPDVVQAVTYIVPARYFIVILRGIFLKGTGIAALWTEYLFLFVFGLIILSVSALKFRKAIG
jgi:ABC-2 type transport system permease protein